MAHEVPGEAGSIPRSPSGLAREWAYAIVTTVYVPMSLPNIQRYLHDLTERLVAALSGPAVDTQAASDVGARLVAAGFTGEQSLPRTVELLGRALPGAAGSTATDPPCGRIIELLGALAGGYTWALRNRVFDQQEEIKRALSLAWQDLERDLRVSEARFREVFDSSPVGIAISEPGGRILRTNSSLNEILGYSPGKLLGRQLSELCSPADQPLVQEHYQDLVTSRASRFRARCTLRRADGETAWVNLAASVLLDADQAPQYLATMVDDITDLHLLEQRLNHQTLHDLQTGMRAAGATLRRLRGRGNRQWDLFDPGIDVTNRAELRLAAAMPGALETGELRVTYQPVVTLAGRQLVGIEAALSWQHPELGVLPNEQCVQAAERTGIVHDVGQWLLRTAAEQAVSWQQRMSGGVPPVVVNLTPSQAQDPDLVARVRTVLNQTGLAPAELELRAPVTAIRTVAGELVGEGGAHAEDNMRVLAELGVRTGLYDFGGGIGGLRCLADFSVCAVQIAQPVSQQVVADPSRILSQAAQALVHLVRAAGVDVVAFPVDSEEQAACWPWIGANWAVGALYGRPGPPADVELRLRRP